MTKMYVLPGLKPEQKQKLTESGIELADWDDSSVLIMTESLVKEALKLLNATADQEATEYEGVVRLKLKYKPVAKPRPVPVAAPRDEGARDRYIKACSSRIASEKEGVAKEAKQHQQTLSGIDQKFVQVKRASAFADASQDVLNQAFQEELERLREIPKVAEVQVVQGSILVSTEPLYASALKSGKLHELGKFLIVVNMDGSDGGIRWFNGSRRIDVDDARKQMNAPNVLADGRACAHELLFTFFELIAHCEFAAVVDLAIQFVEEVPNEELARSIKCWPEADYLRKIA